MPVPYNISAIESAQGRAEAFKATVSQSPAIMGNGIIVSLFLILFSAMISLNVSPQIALFSSALAINILAVLAYFYGMAGVITVSVCIAVLAISGVWVATTR